MIEVKQMTTVYPSGKGVFDVNFKVKKGEVIGFLGPNGAGKTTTIRSLLGFLKPKLGSALINDQNAWDNPTITNKQIGYISGEITFIDGMTGFEHLQLMLDLHKNNNKERMNELLEKFELNPQGKIRRYSKGMKQKLALVSAFMHDPDILILDEPTSGLDPLMQKRFIDLIKEEKAKGKTILISSHQFEEVEKTCDEVIIIKEGKIIEILDKKRLKEYQRKLFVINSPDRDEIEKDLIKGKYEISIVNTNEISVYVTYDKVNSFIQIISKYQILNLEEKQQTLSETFMEFYKSKENSTNDK